MKTKKRVMMQCATAVNKDAIRRETIDGAEHIVIVSFTLPNDIVMNGGLYPADEVDASFTSLDRTLAPVEHPTDLNGNFISAGDPHAIHNFHAGAYNTNIERDGDRIRVEKWVNVQEANKSDRGKRLLDRIHDIETNDNAKPIHTSVGVWLEPEVLSEPAVNAAGQEYTWIARNMTFDHDAILLDNIGAAQPSQGVGMAVNKAGDECEVQTFLLNDDHDDDAVGGGDPSHEEIRELLNKMLNEGRSNHLSMLWVVRVFDTELIFEDGDENLFSVPYRIANGTPQIVGIPLPVERNETYTPKTNQKGDTMREIMINALKALGINVEDGIDDAALLLQYNQSLAVSSSDDNGDGNADDHGDIATVIANAIKPLVEQVTALQTQVNQSGVDEVAALAATIEGSGLYPNLKVEDLIGLKVEKLREMAANATPSHGIAAFNSLSANSDDDSLSATEPPE